MWVHATDFVTNVTSVHVYINNQYWASQQLCGYNPVRGLQIHMGFDRLYLIVSKSQVFHG